MCPLVRFFDGLRDRCPVRRGQGPAHALPHVLCRIAQQPRPLGHISPAQAESRARRPACCPGCWQPTQSTTAAPASCRAPRRWPPPSTSAAGRRQQCASWAGSNGELRPPSRPHGVSSVAVAAGTPAVQSPCSHSATHAWAPRHLLVHPTTCLVHPAHPAGHAAGATASYR